MADETDLLPDLDPELAALVSAYEATTARDAAQVEAALERVTAEVGTAGGAAAVGGMSTATKVGLVGALVAVVGVVGIVAVGPSSEPDVPRTTMESGADEGPRGAAVEAPAVPPSDAQESADPEPARVPVETGATIDPAAPDRRAKPRASSPARRAPEAAREQSSDSLKAELELLQQARSALRRGRAQRALEIVQRHRREYPASRVAEERDATEVAALCAVGRDDEARAKAAVIERRSARSAEDLLGGCR